MKTDLLALIVALGAVAGLRLSPETPSAKTRSTKASIRASGLPDDPMLGEAETRGRRFLAQGVSHAQLDRLLVRLGNAASQLKRARRDPQAVRHFELARALEALGYCQ